LSGSRLRMRTAGRGQDVRPEKALYLNLKKRLIFLHSRVPRPSTSGRLHRQEIRPAAKYLGLNCAPPP